MKIPFLKMHGCGNDFVLVDARNIFAPAWDEFALRFLDRRFGIGADQLLVVESSQAADVRMRTFERNGNESEMCGNGIRCVAWYLRDRGGLSKDEIVFETIGGSKIVRSMSDGRFRVDMGMPIFDPKEIPVATDDIIWGAPHSTDGREVRLHTLSMGNPHTVIFVETEDDLSMVSSVGPSIEQSPLFPKRTNVEFVFSIDPKNLKVRVWERGAGETFACGTGACAVGVVAIREGIAVSPVTLHFKGGDLEIAWNEGEAVFMTGPATYVFEGEVDV